MTTKEKNNEKENNMIYEVMEIVKSKKTNHVKKYQFDTKEDALRFIGESKHRTEFYKKEFTQTGNS